jgi:hypothetical protein
MSTPFLSSSAFSYTRLFSHLFWTQRGLFRPDACALIHSSSPLYWTHEVSGSCLKTIAPVWWFPPWYAVHPKSCPCGHIPILRDGAERFPYLVRNWVEGPSKFVANVSPFRITAFPICEWLVISIILLSSAFPPRTLCWFEPVLPHAFASCLPPASNKEYCSLFSEVDVVRISFSDLLLCFCDLFLCLLRFDVFSIFDAVIDVFVELLAALKRRVQNGL